MIESQVLPLSENYMNLRNYLVKAYRGQSPSKTPEYWLAFSASVPPLGFNTYTISRAKTKGVVHDFFGLSVSLQEDHVNEIS